MTRAGSDDQRVGAAERSSGPGAHDSAGIPFGGRELTSTGFDDDKGLADETLIEALRGGDEQLWMAALAEARLIVPIVAAPVEVDDSADLTVEKETDMAVVTLTAPDGVTALPVFTGVEALGRWNPQARPSPVTAALAAQAAVAEGCDVVLIDLGSEHHVVLRSSMVWALAQQQPWVSAHRDPFIEKAVERTLTPYSVISGYVLEDAGEGVLRIRLALKAGLSQEQLQEIATQVGERLAADGETRARIDGLAFAFELAAS